MPISSKDSCVSSWGISVACSENSIYDRVVPFFGGGAVISRRITSSKCSRATGPWCFSRSRRSSSVYFLRLAACAERRLFVAADRRPLGCMGGSSASCQDGLENLGIVPVVEAPRELVEVERQ